MIHRALMQGVATALDEAEMGCRRIELCDLGFEMLVDHKQCPERAAQVAVATCHDFVDRGFTRSETHSKTPSHCPFGITFATDPVFPLEDVNEAGWRSLQYLHARQSEKVLTMVIKWPTTPV
jgi:hypothetical protein